MKPFALILALLIALAAGFAAGVAASHYLWPPPASVPALVAGSTEPGKVTALGRIEPEGKLITVGVSVPDRLLRFAPGIQRGTVVEADAPLAILASQRDRELEYELVVAQYQEALQKYERAKELGEQRLHLETLRRKQLDALEPLQLAVQQTKLALLEKQAAAAKEGRDRVADLGGVIAKQDREQQELALLQAQTDLRIARETLAQQEKGNQLERELADAKLATARVELAKNLQDIPLDELRRQQGIAKRRLDETTLRAPSSGEILNLYVAPGELVGGSQPVLVLADTTKMAVVAEVYETDRGRVRLGQAVQVTSWAWPGQELSGKVIEIGKLIAKNRFFDVDPTASVDRRVVEVRVRLASPRPAAELIHHQVSVTFLDGPAAP